MAGRPEASDGGAARDSRARWWQTAGGIALLYLGAAATWILVSDRLVEIVFGVGHAAAIAQSVKGLGWISATALALYLLIRSSMRAERVALARAGQLEDLLHAMTRTMDDVFWISEVDPKRVTYISPSIERLWGRTMEELIADPMKWADAILEEDRPGVIAAYEAVVRDPGSGIFEAEYRVRRPDGSVIWVRDRGYPALDSTGRVTRLLGLAEDITERRRRQEEVREREQLLRKLTDEAPGVTYQFQMWPDGRSAVPYASERIRTVFEVTPEQVREDASAAFARTHPEDLAMLQLTIEKSITSLEPWQCEYRVILPKAGLRWLEGRSTPERMPDGSTLWHGYIHDVTERRLSEEALRRSERALKESNERLQAILDNSPNVAIQGYEVDGRVAFWNRASEGLFGYSAGEVMGRRLVGTVLTEEDEEEFLRIVRTAVETGEPAPAREWRTTHADGKPRWCLSSIFPIRFGDDRALVVCMDVDITPRREVESALRESETRFRQLIEAVREVFWMVDWETGRTLHLSPAFETTWGLSRSAAYEDPMVWTSIIHPEDKARVEESFKRDAARGKFDIEYRLIREDGSLRWIHDRAFPILNDRGAVWRVAGVAEDITDRKMAEHRQALLMQELDHRVKNNLAAALSLADMTARHSTTLEQFQEVFTGRLAALARMHALLAVTRWHGVRMDELVLRTLEPFLGAGGCDVQIDGPAGMLSSHVASPMCMALHELTTNAAKHGALGSRDGRLRVRWEMDGPLDAPERLRLWWEERGGPPARSPREDGFGTTLIKGAIEYQLDGTVESRYEPEGFSCRITVDFARTSELAGRWGSGPRGSGDEARTEP